MERQLSEQVKSVEQLQASVAELSAKVRSTDSYDREHVIAGYGLLCCLTVFHLSLEDRIIHTLLFYLTFFSFLMLLLPDKSHNFV